MNATTVKSDPAAFDRYGSTCQFLAWHARQRPETVAFANGDTYRSLALNVVRMMDALAAQGIASGQVVGVETPDRYLHLLILLAAEAASVTTISLVPAECEASVDLGRLCDRIMVSRPAAASDSPKIVPMTMDWITGVFAKEVDERRLEELQGEPAADGLARLIRTSGTTGAPKVMGVTHGMLRGIIESNLCDMPDWLTRHVDFLCLYNFTVRAVHWRALLTLRSGGTIHLTAGDVLWDSIATGAGNYVYFVTGDLARFMRSAPDGGGPFALRIDVNGGPLSTGLLRRVRNELAADLNYQYGANEVQRIAWIGDDGVGTLFPEVRVDIVDERGESLPLGQTGVIRIKSEWMTRGYIDAPELTRAAFIDGWYHSNDLGFQPSEAELVVLGRADDMVNVGGVKVATGPIEERLRSIEGVSDALVTTIDEAAATNVLLVVIETKTDAGPADPRHQVTRIVGAYTNDFRLVVLAELPRTETGKPRREEIKEMSRRITAGETA